MFSCFNQDQPLDRVDFAGLRQRLRQNSVQEKLTRPLDRPVAAQVGGAALNHLVLRRAVERA